jgi:uncharacterized membrane protein (UPF0127 family)
MCNMIKPKTILNYHFLFILLFALSSCEGKSQGVSERINVKPQFFTFHIGEQTIKVELAVLPEERQKGLMFRENMEPGTGMLFVFEQASAQKFWMKNTRIPLDIAYFSPDGKLKEIHAAKPFDLNGVQSRSKNIQFVLELNLHDFRKQKIKIGDRLNLTEIREALIKKGLNPNDYKLAL